MWAAPHAHFAGEFMNAQSETRKTPLDWLVATFGRLAVSIVVPVVVFGVMILGFQWLRAQTPSSNTQKALLSLIAIVWGVGGAALLYVVMNFVVESLPPRLMRLLQPYVFVGPAMAILGWYLALPTLRTFWISLHDRTVWGNIYRCIWLDYRRAGRPQSVREHRQVAHFHADGDFDGRGLVQPWNNLFLIVVMIWMQTGFAMVIFSAAIKGIPDELLEAARVDGANEWQVFFRIMLPYISGTIITVLTTVVIFALKIFDIVQVMTGGQFGTHVIATQFYRQAFTNQNKGYASAIAIVLLITVIPVMIYNLRHFSEEEAF